MADSVWDVRKEFEFVAPTKSYEEALELALASDKKPFMLSDMGDNPTAGGAGDVTWTLTELLKREEFHTPRGKSLIYASIPGPQLVEQALEVGVAGKVSALVGAEIDDRFAPPLLLT